MIYLNAAGTGPLPQRTVDVLAAFNAKRAAPWTITIDETFGVLAESRRLCAKLIGASPDEIALVPNTSTGIHVASLSLPIAPGRAILQHEAEFPANIYPWMARAHHDRRPYETIPLCDGLPDHEALIQRIETGDVGLVAVSWVSSMSGDRADLEAIGAACREVGAWFVVDAIQGLGAVPLDVSRSPIDVLVCGAQKWLRAPWGTGFVYVRRPLITRIEPGTGGWLAMQQSHDLSRYVPARFAYLDDARRFEVATLPYQDFVGMNESLDVLFEAGVDTVARHVADLAKQLVHGIASLPNVGLLTPTDPARSAGIVSFFAEGGMRAKLNAAGVGYSSRDVEMGPLKGSLFRLSPHVYNTAAEIETVLNVLDT
ncbi:MAG TPA: aminotransferase class V-fold PLP-dependent enzyme [Gemmatimonadaceae bacterium]|nr:aminotransferase class V-fold PLP-dependent enzyme [Gemmatimonadaceae bacterium]